MASQTIDLLYGAPAQVLHYDCPEGRPTQIRSSKIFQAATGDDGTEEDAVTSSAAVNAASTTFAAASGVDEGDPRRCNLVATTNILIGRGYLATNALGETERLEVTGVSSDSYVVAREPLQNAYVAADTFVSTRVTQEVASGWVNDTANISGEFTPFPQYRWRLEYVVASVVYTRDVYFDLLRYAGRHDLTPMDVDRRAPGWMQRLPTQYREDQGRSLIDDAYQVIRFDLYNLDTPDQAIRDRGAVNELVALKAIEMVDRDELNARRYADRLNQLAAWGRLPVSVDSGAGSVPSDAARRWRR